MELKESPAAIAGGAAIGMWVGFLPLDGVKTLLALILAWVLGRNKIAAVIFVNLHDLILPLAPALLRLEYELGYWLLSHPHHLPPALSGQDFTLQELKQWTFYFDVGLPVLLGAALYGVVAAAATYGITYAIVRRRRLRAQQRKTMDASP